MRHSCLATALASTLVLALPAAAQDAPPIPADGPDAATHQALRALREGVTEAFNRLGTGQHPEAMPKLLEFLHDGVVLVAMNGETSVGRAGIVDYYQRKLAGPSATVRSLHHTFTPTALTTLYGGDTGISYGTSVGRYELTDGMQFEVTTHYTATLVKEDGKWLLASFQFAPSIFDNPVLDAATAWLAWGVGLALVGGLLLGGLLGRYAFPRRRSA